MQVGIRPKKRYLFTVGDASVPLTSAFSYLGVLLDDHLSWGPLISRKRGEATRINNAIFNFASKIGKRPVKALLKLYQAKSLATACYGSEIWGYTPLSTLQAVENTFLKRLLGVPGGTANMVVQEELGVQTLSLVISLRPLLFWLKCWLNKELSLNHQILREIMDLDHMLDIPWIKYIKKSCEDLGRPNLFYKPETIVKGDIAFVKNSFTLMKKFSLEESEFRKPSVRRHLMLKTSEGIEHYLTRPFTMYERFLLVRFRLDYFHLLLSVPKGSHRGQVFESCGCDFQSPQDLLHFMFFCKFYARPRTHFLIPIFKKLNYAQVRPALFYLQLLHVDCIPFVLGFLKNAVRLRNSMYD